MKISIEREVLLKPLQQVIGAVEKRQTMQILGNVLLRAELGELRLVATDLEIELVAEIQHAVEVPGQVTVPARKLLDICRALPDGALIELRKEGERFVVSSGRSKFTLSTLPVEDFPSLDDMQSEQAFSVQQRELLELIERTSFAMAQQDVRYYLNGLMVEMEPNVVRSVATDGHRLSLCEIAATTGAEESRQVIVPRKGVMELARLLEHSDELVSVEVGGNHIRCSFSGLRYTSKLIDGRFPDYKRVVPSDDGSLLQVSREGLRQALSRTAILSNEKYRGVRMELSRNSLKLQAHNPEQEEAEEELAVVYEGPELEIGFNVNYLMDVVAHLEGEDLAIRLRDSGSSVLVRDGTLTHALYVVMPIRL